MRKILKIDEEFEIYRDSYQWILRQYIPYKNRKGEPAIKNRDTYHMNLNQVSAWMMKLSLAERESLEGLQQSFDEAVDRLTNNHQVE